MHSNWCGRFELSCAAFAQGGYDHDYESWQHRRRLSRVLTAALAARRAARASRGSARQASQEAASGRTERSEATTAVGAPPRPVTVPVHRPVVRRGLRTWARDRFRHMWRYLEDTAVSPIIWHGFLP